MPTTYSPTDIANLALARIGAGAIQDIGENSRNALECNRNFPLAVLETLRSRPWNFALKRAMLTATSNPLQPGASNDPNLQPVQSTPWAPLTPYTVGAYVTFGTGLYQCLIAYTSTANFINDLTAGYWAQMDEPQNSNPGADDYVSQWSYAYQLPADYVLLVQLNGIDVGDNSDQGDDWEIMGTVLYCNAPTADIKYVWAQLDTTQFDAMYTNCLAYNLASKISTALRKDDGALASRMLMEFKNALPAAAQKNSGETRQRRYQPVFDSRWSAARYRSTND